MLVDADLDVVQLQLWKREAQDGLLGLREIDVNEIRRFGLPAVEIEQWRQIKTRTRVHAALSLPLG